MKQTLVKNEQEFMSIFKDDYFEDVEKLLNIQYAYADGQFPDDLNCDESLPLAKSIYRKIDNIDFPERYPCVVISCIEDDFNGFGPIKIRILRFVYLKDFYSWLK